MDEPLHQQATKMCGIDKFVPVRIKAMYGTSVIPHVTLPCRTTLRWVTCLELVGKVDKEDSG